jgi:hypothetical protein
MPEGRCSGGYRAGCGQAAIGCRNLRMRFLMAKAELSADELRFTDVDHHNHEAL